MTSLHLDGSKNGQAPCRAWIASSSCFVPPWAWLWRGTGSGRFGRLTRRSCAIFMKCLSRTTRPAGSPLIVRVAHLRKLPIKYAERLAKNEALPRADEVIQVMDWRAFFAALAGGLLAAPLAAEAQQAGKWCSPPNGGYGLTGRPPGDGGVHG